MGSAGYGNHEASVGERASPEAASRKPEGGGTDRPGMDLGGARDRSGPAGVPAGARSSPDPAGAGPHSGLKDSGSPTLSDDDRRQVSTPGDGAGPTSPQGNEVDPGAG